MAGLFSEEILADRARLNKSSLPDTLKLLVQGEADLGGGAYSEGYTPTGIAIPCRVTRPMLPADQMAALQIQHNQLYRVSCDRGQAAFPIDSRLRLTIARGALAGVIDVDYLIEAVKSQPTEYAFFAKGPAT